VAVPLVTNDLELLVDLGIAEGHPEEEAVELGLGQRERALELDRVLRREHHEGLGQLAGDAVGRHLALGHRLEQGGLRLGHRPVDLVDEDDVGEDRPGTELEVPELLVPDRQAGDIRGLKVGRALNARRLGILDRQCDCARQHRLRRSRHVLEEDMALAGEGGEHELDLLTLAAHGEFDVVEDALRDVGGSLQLLVFSLGGRSSGLHGVLNIGLARIDLPLSGHRTV
jgi:hypothetical protein